MLEETPGLRFLPLDFAQLEVFATLQTIRDPFDRVIVSATISQGARLMTKDALLTDSGLVHAVW